MLVFGAVCIASANALLRVLTLLPALALGPLAGELR